MKLHPDIERLALLGWRLFPGSNRSRAACFADASERASFDLDTLALWSREYPRCGWRMVPKGSGVWGIDVDAPGEGHAADGIGAMRELVERHGPLPVGPRIRTGGGGVMIFFSGPPSGTQITGRTGQPRPGIDPRRGRQQVTLPPSLHFRTRELYRWIVPPWELAPPPAPAWLIDLLREPERAPLEAIEPQWCEIGAERLLDTAKSKVACAKEGTRNGTLNAWAYHTARCAAGGYISAPYVASELFAAARAAGLQDNEIRNTLESAFTAAAKSPLVVDKEKSPHD